MTKIEELEQKLNECQKALAELKESKKEGKWKPALNKLYWYRGDEGINLFDTWENDEIDEWRRKNLKIFETEEQCEKYWKFMDTVKEKSYEFTVNDWKKHDGKFYIYYNGIIGKFIVGGEGIRKNLGTIYFKTATDAQYIIDNYEEELMKYFL